MVGSAWVTRCDANPDVTAHQERDVVIAANSSNFPFHDPFEV